LETLLLKAQLGVPAAILLAEAGYSDLPETITVTDAPA
jgi:hypothetical protein